MERYFIIMLVAMLAGVTIEKEKRREAHSRIFQQEEAMIATIPSGINVGYADLHAIYVELETSWNVRNEERIYEIIVNNNSTPKIAKNSRRRGNKATCSANPRILFNVLRSLPMGEPYFIQ